METYRIYMIKNLVNGKVYIGQTSQTLEKRFSQHLYDSDVETKYHRPLYNAIRKYGKCNFSISLIEECDSSSADEREQFWISTYGANGEAGYNATIGGKMYEPYDCGQIESLIRDGKTTKEIKKIVGCCKDTVYRVARQSGIAITGRSHDQPVVQMDLDGNYLADFENVSAAARYLKENCSVTSDVKTMRKCISRCCHSENRTKAYGYAWRYVTT